jgi:hypothetical protein
MDGIPVQKMNEDAQLRINIREPQLIIWKNVRGLDQDSSGTSSKVCPRY